MSVIRLLGFQPDSDPTVLGAIISGSAFVPTLRGFKGAPTPVTGALATLAATCQGAAALTKLDGTYRLFAGTPTKLYESGASTWTDVSAVTYTTAVTGSWRFAQFGNVSLAANGADTVQSSTSSGAFSSIAGAPVAAIIECVGAFVFALNTSANAHGWQCSAINDPQTWATSIASQAVSGVLTATSGPITAGKAFGSQIVAFKKNSMYLGTYVGAPNVWQFDLIMGGTAGAMSQEAVVSVGTSEDPKLIFMGVDDFYMYDGAKPIPIGTNRVREYVFNSINQNRYYACKALLDKKNTLIYFYYPVSDSAQPDHCVVYNYRTNTWGVDDRQIEATTQYINVGMTYNALGSSYSTYDDLPNLTYDSAFVVATAEVPAIFATNHLLKTMNGVAGSSSFTLGDVGDDMQEFDLQRIRPRWMTAPDSATMTNYWRNNLGDSLNTDQTTSLSSSNTFDVVREARWHRLSFTMSGDWELSVIAPEYSEAGLE